jgi:hypothetical protein
MNKYVNLLEPIIQHHLKGLINFLKLSSDEQTFELIAKNWLDKKTTFECKITELDMIEVDFFNKVNKKAVMLMTYSGSLISLGNLINDNRWVGYTSIEIRTDVPELIIVNSQLAKDIHKNKVVEFINGNIKRTSPVIKIAEFTDKIDYELQDQKLKDATLFLRNEFIKLNQQMMEELSAS